MNNYRKVTKEMKVRILEMKSDGETNAAIAETLNISPSTVSYHSSEKHRQLAIERAKRNERVRDRIKYMREYQSERYNNDPEYKEKVQKMNRENWRKKHGKSNNLS